MAETHHPNYTRIYFTLLVLLAISVAGPLVGIKWVTILSAFGIAIVKATMVINNFMHLKWERRIAKYVLAASGALLLLFYYGVAPDIQFHRGEHWTNDAALAATARGIPTPEAVERAHEGGREGGAPAHEGAAATPEPESTMAAAGTPAAFEARTTFVSNCSPCHGSGGAGDGPVSASLDPRPANFTAAAFWRGKQDAELVKAIREGGASVGRSPSMPAWSSLMTHEQAEAMVRFLKTLRR